MHSAFTAFITYLSQKAPSIYSDVNAYDNVLEETKEIWKKFEKFYHIAHIVQVLKKKFDSRLDRVLEAFKIR